MKHLAPYAMMLMVFLTSTPGFSQVSSKPKQFSSYPDVINCSISELDRIFTSIAGDNLSLSFSDNFSFAGPVTSNVRKYSNLQTANIKSAVFNNSVFNISKRINADNSITYVGRIINKAYFDGYVLKQNTNGNYQLVKIETDQLIQDCKQL